MHTNMIFSEGSRADCVCLNHHSEEFVHVRQLALIYIILERNQSNWCFQQTLSIIINVEKGWKCCPNVATNADSQIYLLVTTLERLIV